MDMRLLIGIGASLLVLAALAIEPPKPATPPARAPQNREPVSTPPSAPASEAPSPEGADTAAAEAEGEEETLPPLPADAAPSGPPPARFNPTEKVRADFPVSFPIDI